MGDKFVIITPSSNVDFYANGDYLYGENEMGMDTMFTELNKMIIQVEAMLTSINNIVGAPGFQTSIVQLVVNMEQMTAHHEGAVDMARDEVADGQNPHAITLAEQIINDQEAEIAQMQQMLTDL